MNAGAVALRAGVHRGWIEFRQNMTNAQDVWSVVFFPVIALIVMYMLRGDKVPGTDFSLGSQSIPGILGMNLVLNGLLALAMALTMDREDGTLLRAKATPNGMIGYLTGKVISRAGTSVVGLLIPLVPAAFLFDSEQGMGVVMLPMMLLMAISGVFYPITALPEWLQWIAQGFPIYWLGLGLRSALLPVAMSAAEIGESWRHLETIGVLGAWAVIGLLLAPVVLLRMARRESGSSVAARRRKAMQRPM